MSKAITTGDENLRDKWYELAAETNDLNQLTTFIGHLMNDYTHDYESYVHAVSASAMATIHLTGHDLSGFQAGCVMWEIVREMMFKNNQTGMTLINYDDFLYPQYKYKFERSISEETWKLIQEAAANKLAEAAKNQEYVNPKVIDHWTSIVCGNVPFGYSVRKDT